MNRTKQVNGNKSNSKAASRLGIDHCRIPTPEYVHFSVTEQIEKFEVDFILKFRHKDDKKSTKSNRQFLLSVFRAVASCPVSML